MILFLLACDPVPSCDTACGDAADSTIDARLDPADVVPELTGGEFWQGPDVLIEPLAEVQYCAFGTYTGPDIGIHSFQSFQASVGHHLILLGTNASTVDYPDGAVVDCTKTNQMMTTFEPLINAEPTGAGSSFIELPEGMAVKLKNGQRWVVQAHYLNTTENRYRVQDVMDIGFMPLEDVTTPAAAFALTRTDLSLPAGEATHLDFDCAFPTDYTVLYLTGHMHEFGKVFSFAKDGEEVYTIDAWETSFRDQPPLKKFADGEFTFPANSVLNTSCDWFNDSDEALEFPAEMCATYGMLYPSLTPVVCSD